MIDPTEIEAALRERLPSDVQKDVPALAQIIADGLNRARSMQGPQEQSIFSPELQRVAHNLSGQTIQVQDTALSFGEGSQVGDVTIKAAAGRDLTNITINIGDLPGFERSMQRRNTVLIGGATAFGLLAVLVAFFMAPRIFLPNTNLASAPTEVGSDASNVTPANVLASEASTTQPTAAATLTPTMPTTDTPTTAQGTTIPAQIGDIEPGEDVPGPVIPSGTKLNRVLDYVSRQRDVYAVTLRAGQEAQLLVQSSDQVFVSFGPPGISTFENQGARLCTYSTNCITSFLAAVDGDYQISVLAGRASIEYSLSVTVVDKVTMPERSDDVPGAPLPASGQVTSVIDVQSQDRDVFTIQMQAGQEAKLLVQSSDQVFVSFGPPGISTFENQGAPLCTYSTNCITSFLAAVDGDYQIAVLTGQASVEYSLSVTVADKVAMPERSDDVPGAPLPASGQVTSVIDEQSRNRDVFAIELKAGQEVELLVQSSDQVFISYGGPELTTYQKGASRLCNYSTNCVTSFKAATDGPHYIVVLTGKPSVSYSLKATVR